MVSPAKCIAGRSVADWIAAYPVVSDLCALKETAWTNPDKLPFAQAAAACPLLSADTRDLSGQCYGSMLLKLPAELAVAQQAMEYMRSQSGVTVEEVTGI